MKNLINSFFKLFGFKVKKIKKKKYSSQNERIKLELEKKPQPTFIEGLLMGLLITKKEPIQIIQVGANDGVNADPIYRFIKSNKNEVNVLLVEPQSDVMEQLKSNYTFHPKPMFAEVAVGKMGIMQLYRIKKEFHNYYQGIIASGITSFDKNYVIYKAKKQLPKSLHRQHSIDEIIEKKDVIVKTLTELIEEYFDDKIIDMIQIDTEGYDDEVIYSLDLESIKPRIIHYEMTHFDNQKKKKLLEHFNNNGYKVIQSTNSDECAIYDEDSSFLTTE